MDIIKKSKIISIFTVLLILFALTDVSAQPAGQLSDNEVNERINYIQNTLDDGSGMANLWWWGWAGIYAGLSAGQLALYKQIDDGKITNEDLIEKKNTLLVGGVKSGLAMIGMFIDPMVPAYAAGSLRGIPGGDLAANKAKLGEAEILLKKCAKRAIKGRSWIKHALAFIVNAGGSCILYFHYDESVGDSILSFASGMLVSEATIWTQPMRAVEDWDNYRKKYNVPDLAYDRYENDWFLVPYYGGLGVGTYF